MAHANDGRFVWYEHMTKDPKAAIAFYSEVVGWKTQPFTESAKPYTMWVGSSGPLGGVMDLPPDAEKMGVPSHWMGSVQVADVDATVAAIKAKGGKVHHGPIDIPMVGRYAVVGDPQGAALSVFKPTQAMELHAMEKEGEFCWNELMTTDAKAALGFYGELFGWKVLQEMDMGPMGTYFIFGQGDVRLGGMMNLPDAKMPPAWLYYTQTADLDAALARATKRGAKVQNGPMEVPGGGKIAQLTDPQGAWFALHQNPKK